MPLLRRTFDSRDTHSAVARAQGVLQLIQSGGWKDAIKNPESFPFMSLSYWLTKNRAGTPANAGDPAPTIDWSKGVSAEWKD
jgi:hypothetical protein